MLQNCFSDPTAQFINREFFASNVEQLIASSVVGPRHVPMQAATYASLIYSHILQIIDIKKISFMTVIIPSDVIHAG